MIDGIFFRTRTGCPWRDLPERFGNWKTVYNRHRRWSADGTWEMILDRLRAGCDEAEGQAWTVAADATVVRAHQHAARARREPPADVDPADLAPAALSVPARRRGAGGLPNREAPLPGRADQQDPPAGRFRLSAAGPGHQRRAAPRFPGKVPPDARE